MSDIKYMISVIDFVNTITEADRSMLAILMALIKHFDLYEKSADQAHLYQLDFERDEFFPRATPLHENPLMNETEC